MTHSRADTVTGVTQTARPLVRMPLKVRFHECDPQGVVFNAHYLAYADMASFECLTVLFGSIAEVHRMGVDLVVAESNVRYLAACRFQDELLVDSYVGRVGKTSLVLRFDMYRAGEPVAAVVNRYVWVDPQSLRPTRPPDAVRHAFTAYLPG
jgi:acyl-CoA thioester hydrolase